MKNNLMERAACVGMEEAAAMLGFPPYYLPVLVRAGLLKPLGKPAQNSRKWFATIELEQRCQDREWLDKAVRAAEKSIQEGNTKRRSKQDEPPPGSQ